jgi:1-acyl-sn-glycerol-3-phosphate acyltransferase
MATAKKPAENPAEKKTTGSRALSQAIAFYEKLDPKAKAMVRQEILSRAGQDELARTCEEVSDVVARQAELSVSKGPEEFEPFSDQIFEYLRQVRKAWSEYLPFDQYDPGDESRIDLVRRETLRAMEPLEWMLKTYFRYEVKGLENIPKTGRSMIVSNHGLLPIDGWFLSYEVLRATGRWPRGLTDWRIFRFPYLRQFFMDMGAVVGSHENGDKLLQGEKLLFIMPGGSKEAWKSSKWRYRLLWRKRYGFIRLALRNRCPIIPSANVGTDDTYHVFFNGYMTAYKFFRTKKALLPISLPVGLGVLPLPVKMTQYVGAPIHFPYPPEAEKDPAIVKLCQEQVKAAIYDLIDQGLQEREGIDQIPS